MKKFLVIAHLIVFLNLQIFPGYAYQLIPEYLCQAGIKFYQQGRFDEALHEFKKVLLIEPEDRTALEYISKIEGKDQIRQQPWEEEQKEQLPAAEPAGLEDAVAALSRDVITMRQGSMDNALGTLEKQVSQPKEKKLPNQQITGKTGIWSGFFRPKKTGARPHVLPSPEGLSDIRIIKLEIPQSNEARLIEIEQNRSLIVSGRAIRRYLVTSPNILKVQKNGPDELLVTGDNIGYTYLQVWDEQGRWTREFFTTVPQPNIEMLAQNSRLEQEKAGNFKLGYSMDWSLYEEGRSLTSLKRSSYSFIHNLALTGETPYGDFDSSIGVNRFDTKTDVGHATIGLTRAKLGPFSDFNLRGFDFFDVPPDFANMTFPGITLRGAMLNSGAFHNRLNYTAFIGRENWLGFGNLSPEVNRPKKSYLDGFNLKYLPGPQQEYQFTVVQGFGKDRDKNLHDFGYNLSGEWSLNKWILGAESAFDSDSFANVVDLHYVLPKLDFGSEFRDISKKFNSSSGTSSRQGQLGWLFDLYYRPWENLQSRVSLDLYRDRLYPAPENMGRFNQDFNWNVNYYLDPLTSLRLNYVLQNDLGKLWQYRYQSANMGASKTIKLIRDINLYWDYYHQENTNYASHPSDYVNDRVFAGARLNLLPYLYYYANQEVNWLREGYTGNASTPSAFETGLDWSNRIGASPFYATMRFTYRNEEDTLSQLSFLSGQDYVEGYSQLSYRPTNDMEFYGSCRMRNVWADNPRVEKHFEANINGGMRYLWDTGVNWQPIGGIDGYVFKDYNGDGIMQRNEPPVEKVKVFLGKHKAQLTDIFGYYDFQNIRARTAYINLDTSSLPAGYVLTGPAAQGAAILQHGIVRLDFGIVSRSEIYGYVFEDVNDNGVFDKDDLGIRDVVLTLEDNSRRITDSNGRYSFSNAAVGVHTVILDLNSVPIYYLPKVALAKKITLSEGVSYLYNIPLKKNK